MMSPEEIEQKIIEKEARWLQFNSMMTPTDDRSMLTLRRLILETVIDCPILKLDPIEDDGIPKPKIDLIYPSFSYMETFKVNNKEYELSIRLSDIKKSILGSEYITGLTEDWDDEGAQTVSSDVYDAAINFVVEYSTNLFDRQDAFVSSTKLDNTVLVTPEINPCRDGSVDIYWRKETTRLLVNISSKENSWISYYGDVNKENKIKNEHSATMFSQELADWMENLYKNS